MRTALNYGRLERRRIEAPCAVEARAPIPGFHAFDAYLGTRARRVQEAPVAEIYADVRIRLVSRVVEDEVARLQILCSYGLAYLAEGLGARGQAHAPRTLEDMGNESAAIEARLRRAAAVAVLHADCLHRMHQWPFAVGSRAVVPRPRGKACGCGEEKNGVSHNGHVH